MGASGNGCPGSEQEPTVGRWAAWDEEGWRSRVVMPAALVCWDW